MKTGSVLLLVVALAPAAGLRAQEPAASTSPSTWKRPAIHWSKWVTLGAAATLTALAEREHRSSQREWDQLLQICLANNNDCAIGTDGRYVTYQSELHYEKSIYYAHRARRRLIGGQLGLLASAALFIADLHGGTDQPKNIPFHAMEVTPGLGGNGVNVGVRLRF